MARSYEGELTNTDLDRIAKDFRDFVESEYRELEPGIREDYPLKYMMEDFATEYPLEPLGKGAHRAVFESGPELPGEKDAVVKFPRVDAESHRGYETVNRREAVTWKIVEEAGIYDPEWYAEVYEAALDGSFLVQEKVDSPSVLSPTLQNPAIMYIRTRFRLFTGVDDRVRDLKPQNIGARGLQPVYVDFPWFNEHLLETSAPDGARFLTEI